MLRKLLSPFLLVAGAAVVASSIYLASTSPEDPNQGLRYAAAAIAGIPGAIAVVKIVYDYFRPGDDDIALKKRVEQSLYTGLLAISRDPHHIYKGDVTQVSFHVWVLPTWYRHNYRAWVRVRQVVRPNRVPIPKTFKPPLIRLAVARLDHKEQSSGLTFRKGTGMVGRCVENDKSDKALIARFNSDEFAAAISSSTAWKAASEEVHHGLSRQDAGRLAESYTQAAAIVIRDQRSVPIGCVTLDLPPKTETRFKRSASNVHSTDDPLIAALMTTAEQVTRNLCN